jgi:hypothetical protein
MRGIMFNVKYIEYGRYLTLATLSSYSDALKFKNKKEKQCGGMWHIETVAVLASYEDADALYADFDPYKRNN